MAIAIDGSSPAGVTSSGATTDTAAFTPPNSCVIFAFASADANNGSNDESLSVTDSASGTWNTAVQGNGNGGAASAIFWRLCATSPGSMTVSLADNKGSVAKRLFVQVLTGTDQTSPVGATTAGTTAAVSYTSTVDQSLGFSCGLTANATLTAGGSGNNLLDEFGGFDSGDAVFTLDKTAATSPAGTTVTLTIAGTATIGHHVAAEVLPPGVATVPYNPQRSVQGRDPGETWWIQRDRRDANTVATAANPLPSPLDTAWQAGAGYWHLYGDRGRPAWWPQQRAATDPTLLSQAAAAVPPAAARSVQARDPGEAQWLQRRSSDPALLATALLENELLGGAGTVQRANTPASNAPRTWMPQQPTRAGTTPGLLDQAELEGNLLGGAETSKRVSAAATNAPRWWMPEQPKRDATTPGLLDTALLEGPALDSRRTGHPALYVDRREMPQQRAYLSDPSFYPTTTPTDPLTLAWGAGGTYWLIYNTAAVDVDRRESPQQRRYVSDPGLLASALLENELLGGAGTAGRHAAAYVDRREVPLQRLYISDPSLLATAQLENELLGGADYGRHLAVYADRRTTVPQVQRYLVQQAGPADPLFLTGDLLRRYLLAATHGDRRLAGQQPLRLQAFVTLPGQIFSGYLTSTSSAARLAQSSTAGTLSTASSTASLTNTSGGDS